jgi:FixJ family two-component response regulator
MKLSKREVQVLNRLLDGASTEVIAQELNIQKEAVSVYVSRVRRKVEQCRLFLSYVARYKPILQTKYKNLEVTPEKTEEE